ncbi:Uncharacterized conserved protein [Peptoclostridium litorale DSM 5388]|uniref:6-hydroxymethylpterin diphosphokinase MptE-like domain-containing protein n=1 Tax=Peptoclostridium litorale DSM 5388 TaxID=1121324 RepID=A0A069RKK5_PEPLI|nr:6-hydroxymethylpterin diphosphokinase MptE-like protein [Peptoclostridium litorale]KDR94762.1 hypothetical protein CLIT_13c00840 [Peptoclostridium litorale DSM 5388]SIN92126.1 Uncharacterized conserved protein [Peptoclostridium litorale DSM 5388]
MDIFNKNLNILKKTSKALYDTIIKEKALYNVKLEPFSDEYNFLVEYENKKCYMHSIYDINNEMKNIFGDMDGKEEMVVLFGIGEGHALKYIKNNYSKVSNIIVIEPSLAIFKNFVGRHDLTDYVSGLSISFLVNKSPEFIGEELGKYISKDNIKIISHVTHRTLFGEYSYKMLKIAKDIVTMRLGNYNFARNMNRQLVINSLVNMDYGYVNADKIKELLKGKPLIVVAAGPSLNKNIHLLKDIKDKAIIIAAGTAMKILDSKGIKPHFRMAFDGHQNELKVFEGIDTEDVPLIYSNTLYYDIAPNYKGKKICMNIVSNHFSNYINKKLNIDYEAIESGPTIVIGAMDMGVVFGSSKIIFLGLDLAITENAMYASGAGGNREKEHNTHINKEDFVEEKDIYGNKVYTTKGFHMNRLGIEKVIKANKNVEFIDATEGGLKKKGTIVKPFEQVIEEDLKERYDFSNIENIIDVSDEERVVYRNEISLVIDGLLEEIKEIEKINEERIKRLKIINKYIEKRIKNNASLHELREMNVYEKQMMQIDLYKYLVEPSLSFKFAAIVDKFSYHGQDNIEKARCQAKKFLGISAEIIMFLELLEDGCKLKKEDRLYEFLKSN